MENATRALLIAGAVLIVVLLIALGMRIFNQAQNAADVDATATSLKTQITDSTSGLTDFSIYNNKIHLKAKCKDIATRAVNAGYTVQVDGEVLTAVPGSSTFSAARYKVTVTGTTVKFTAQS